MRRYSRLAIALGLSLAPLSQAADQKLATLEVSVTEDAAKTAKGIRTLFVIVYDAESQARMPYGALKVDLKADAQGRIFKGDLTIANLSIMQPNAPVPKKLRLKARLDKDGGAGADQPGDAVGKLDSLNAGDTGKIVINTSI